MSINRVFLDWTRPALTAAVEWLVERFSAVGQLNLENVVLALPGSRAGRRLLEILVAEAEKRHLQLCPPRIVTAGSLPELLYIAQRPFAETLVQQLAWITALRKTDRRNVQMIVPSAPPQDDLLAWLSLGEMLARLHRELAADALDFPEVVKCGSKIEGFREIARWQALAEIQQQYLATLDNLSLWDKQTARLVAIRQKECRTDDHIVLIGASDLNRSQRMMLDQVADRVTALVFAPQKLADRFDEHGCIYTAAWLMQEIPLADDQMEVAEDPGEQADAVIRAIARFEGRYNTEQIVYQNEHMPGILSGQWQENGKSCDAVERLYKAVQGLCQPLEGKSRPLTDWTPPVLELLTAIFGGATLRTDIDPDRSILAACEQIREALGEQLATPKGMMPSVTGIEAIHLVLRQIEGGYIPPLLDHGAMELLGWLELPLDDAPALIVTGFNEGCVPASLNADVFLPNQLRRALGIEDNDRRYARDAYALSMLAASRERLHVIAGRRNAAADPMLPSRLLFAADDVTMAKRVTTFFAGEESPARPKIEFGKLRHGREMSLLEVPQPKPLAGPITSMRVTEFKDYLACPYRYYLRHVLKLEALADSAEELDGAGFGSLAHEVLSLLHNDPDVAVAKAETIAKFLDSQLDAAVLAHFGKEPLPSIRVQVEQLRRRLAAFAQWQEDWAGQGWRIEHTEVSPKAGKAFLDVGGSPMQLRGRVDRIDVNDTSGRRMIFDYKTSDRATSPEKAHRKKSGEWIDLQLPLYRHLVSSLGITERVDMAYVVLPKDISAVGHLPAEWTPEDFASADSAAAEVIGHVRAEDFWPPANPPPAFSENFATICQDNRFAAAIAKEAAAGTM